MTLQDNRLASLNTGTQELLHMLTYMRPHGSDTERAFINRYIAPTGAKPDDFGNLWLTIGQSPIMWCSHTDTVHKKPGKQRVLYGAGLASADKSDCLGADCTTGVWLMLQMIRAKVPGTYVFHRAEEIGGKGSAWIAKNLPGRLSKFQFAIAFDRMGTDEIITHQMGWRCASDAFAESMARALMPLIYVGSDGGSFTDTANYVGIVPECTNIAVGYYGQHGKNETQDIDHALALRDRLCTAGFSKLVCQRDPTMPDEEYTGGRDFEDMKDMKDMVYQEHGLVARFLHTQGYTVADILDFGRADNDDDPDAWEDLGQ
jgi:hypothetical protein